MKNSVPIGPDTVVVQTENLLASDLDGETVLMSLERAAYYGLDSTAQHIWNRLTEPTRVADLCEELVQGYDVERTECEHQVREFLTELNDEGLIRIV